MDKSISHQIYKPQPNLQKADGIAWIFTNKDSKLQKYSFNFPELQDDEVRMKILHSGLCQTDSLYARGMWVGPSYPLCVGHEIVGEITKVGKNVQNFKIGEVVGVGHQGNHCQECDACKRDETNLCEKYECVFDPTFGGFASHVQTKAKQTFKIPEGMPLDKIPPLLCAGMTVWAPIKRWYDSQKDKSNLKAGVFGIGGLGHLALQILNKLGVKVSAFTTSFNREKELKEFGAHDLSHSTDLESLGSEKVKGQYNMILNTLHLEDQDQFVAVQRLIKKGGSLVQLGIPPTRTNLSLDVMTLVFNQISLQGSIIASVKETNEFLDFASKNKIYPTCQHFDFENFNDALDLLENGRPKFRAVVNVTDWAKKNGFNK